MKHFFPRFLWWAFVLVVACVVGAFPIFGPIATREASYFISHAHKPEENFCDPSLAQYELCIPKIRIRGEVIEEGSLNLVNINPKLQSGIVHLQASAGPGKYGNGVYFGHSDDVPWDTGPYKTIFALLNKLEANDEVVLIRKGEIFHYRVSEKQIVSPSNTSVLNEDSQTQQITLITCWPPGTTFKRLVVTAYYEP